MPTGSRVGRCVVVTLFIAFIAPAWAKERSIFDPPTVVIWIKDDPEVYYSPRDTPLASTILSCLNPGDKVKVDKTTESTIKWMVGAGGSIGIKWGPVEEKLQESFSVEIGKRQSITVSRTFTPTLCYTSTLNAYPSYHRKIYHAIQDPEPGVRIVREFSVYFPVDGLAPIWTKTKPEPLCPGCCHSVKGMSCGSPPQDEGLLACMSDNPELPADDCLTVVSIPTLSKGGLALLAVLLASIGAFATRYLPKRFNTR